MILSSSSWALLILASSTLAIGAVGCSKGDVVDETCPNVGESKACQHSTGCPASQECTKDGWSGCACEPSEDVGAGGSGGAGSCTSLQVTTAIKARESATADGQELVYAANTSGDVYFQLELYGGGNLPALTAGTFALGEGDEGNYATCSRCAILVSPDTGRTFLANEGTLVLQTVTAGGSKGSLTNARFVEVDIDENTSQSTLVTEGECFGLANMTFDTSPPAGWECSGPQYVDDKCHCGCGVLDPACSSKTAACDVDTCQVGQKPDPVDNTKCVAN